MNSSEHRIARWLIETALGALLGAAAMAVLLKHEPPCPPSLLESAARCRKGVFLATVEYGLRHGSEVVFRWTGAGTCFLVRGNRLVSNRHVFCPWLSDKERRELEQEWKSRRDAGAACELYHRIWIHRDGEPAYRKKPGPFGYGPSDSLDDLYLPPFLRTDDPSPTLRLIGTDPPPSSHSRCLARDIAVLQVLKPAELRDAIPLEIAPTPATPLEPVAAIGFPLSGEFEKSLACAAVSRGEIRRHLDTGSVEAGMTCYPGNSGGPLINARGQVVGMTTATIGRSDAYGRRHYAEHQIAFAVPAAHMQQILDRLDAGRPLWNGVIDPGREHKLQEALRLVSLGQYTKAHSTFYWGVQARNEPDFLLADAIFRHLNNNTREAIIQCQNALLISPDSARAQFLLLLFIALEKRSGLDQLAAASPDRATPADSESTLYDHAGKIMLGKMTAPTETSDTDPVLQRFIWVYAAAIAKLLNNQPDEARPLLLQAWRHANLSVVETLLVLRELERLQQQRVITTSWKKNLASRYKTDRKLRETMNELERIFGRGD